MKILGIETSCDETSASVVENGTDILSIIISSSSSLHTKTGGIIPEIAAREQVKYILPVIEQALKQTTEGLSLSSLDRLMRIDAIAVTAGPGLIGSLLIGVETAKTLSLVSGKPLIPVNHVFGHIYANWLAGKKPIFPAVALVASGGHTELFLLKNHQSIKWLGGTLDDAAGEVLDKTARMLGLSFPGGPAIAREAEKYNRLRKKKSISLPRPMIGSKNLNFSFSGLKTAVLREIIKNDNSHQKMQNLIPSFAHEIEEVITDVLVKKTITACHKHKAKSILLSGGVAASNRLRVKFRSQLANLKFGPVLYAPPPFLCTDNASFVASYAYFHYRPVPWQKVEAYPSLKVEV